MSMRVDLELTRVWRAKLGASIAPRIVCKFLGLRADEEEIASPHAGDHVWRPGINVAKGRLPVPLVDGAIANGGGFHVLLEPPDDVGTHSMGGRDLVCVPLRAFSRDLLVAGHHEHSGEVQAMFRRLDLAFADYELARKELLELRRLAALREERLAKARPARMAEFRRVKEIVRARRAGPRAVSREDAQRLRAWAEANVIQGFRDPASEPPEVDLDDLARELFPDACYDPREWDPPDPPPAAAA